MKVGVYKASGLIIKKADLGDTGRLLTIYTQELGKIQARAKGVRKITSKLKGYLELFTYSQFMIARSKTIDIITDAAPIDSFANLRSHLESLNYAFYVSEIADKLIAGSERDGYLWPLLLKTFQGLNQGLKPINFEKNILKILGYGFSDKNPLDVIQEITNQEIKSKIWLTK